MLQFRPVFTPEAHIPSPLVTIAIPAYRQEAFIAEAVHAALAQSVTDTEVVVVDDGSPDGTAGIVEAIAAREPRVALHRNATNLGICGNWNRALSLARGEFVLLTHGDDRMRPRMVERLLGALRGCKDASLALGNQVEIDETGALTGRSIYDPPADRDCALPSAEFLAQIITCRRPRFVTATAFARRETWTAVGPFDERFRYVLDMRQWARFALRGAMAYVHEEVLENREHAGRGTHTLRSLRSAIENVAVRLDAFEAASQAGIFVDAERDAVAEALGVYLAREARRIAREDREAASLVLSRLRAVHRRSLWSGNGIAARLRTLTARVLGRRPGGPAAELARELLVDPRPL